MLALTAIGVVLGLWIALGLNNKAIEIKTSYQLLGDLTPGQLAAVPETVIASTPDARVGFAPAGGPATPFSDAGTIPDISARAAAQTPNVAMLVGTSALSTFARPAPAPLAASSTPAATTPAATTPGRTRSVNLADQAAEPATPPQAIAQPELEDGGRAPIQATESGLTQGAETQPALASSSIR
ncbi:MAG: hypothetical protein K2Q25_02975 [Mycobacteriaceae bacterium]|nr:hypothetical protein [Mycobacteriaceae bacterium]